MDSSPKSSSMHGILQVRILDWVAISYSKGSSQPRDQTNVSCIVGRVFTTETKGKLKESYMTEQLNTHLQIVVMVHNAVSILKTTELYTLFFLEVLLKYYWHILVYVKVYSRMIWLTYNIKRL